MRRIDLLINEARAETDNILFTDDTGIQDSQFLRWANSAQSRIISLIQQQHPNLFQRENIIDAVQGQEEYDIPSNTFLGTRIQMVEYSRTGRVRDYYTLKASSIHERVNGPAGNPSFYIRFTDTFLCQPRPDTTGSFRIITQLALPRVDLRRANVSSVVLGTNTITSLIFDTTQHIDATDMQDEGYITIVDRDGNIKMQGIPVDEVNTTTGEVTILSSFTFSSGETIAAGDWAVLGRYSTTNSILPEVAERYLVDFMIWKLEKRDSSNAANEYSQELFQQETDIMTSFALPDDDVSYVTILDPQYLDYEDYT